MYNMYLVICIIWLQYPQCNTDCTMLFTVYSIHCSSQYRWLILTLHFVKTNRDVLLIFYGIKHQKPLNVTELIYETWHSETQQFNKQGDFPKYYWLNQKPIVHSKQIMLYYLVNKNAVHWWISIECGVIFPLEVQNHQQCTKND